MISSDNDKKYIYIVLSETPSLFGRLIRKATGSKYNHASIAFDSKFEELYSFARKQNCVPIVAGLVREYPERFSLKRVSNVNIKAYKIEVTEEQYRKGKERIIQIRDDEDEYLYNLFSVLTFPLFHGFPTFKAFSCVEFVAHITYYMGVPVQSNKKVYEYTPEDFGNSLGVEPYYEGNLLTYCTEQSQESQYFFMKPRYTTSIWNSCMVVGRLLYRKLRYFRYAN